MKGELARQREKPHVLNQARLSVSIYHEFLDGLKATAGGADKAQVSQQSEMKEQKLHIAVDPDVMEFVTASAFHDQLNNSLAARKSEITWQPNTKVAVIVYQGGDSSDSWQSECIDEVQNFLGKFVKHDVQVNVDSWRAVEAQLSSIRNCLGVDPPLVKLIDDSFFARIVSLSSDVKGYEEKLKCKLEEIYREEIRKTYQKRKVPNVPEEHLILLMKINFVEKLQETNKELEIKLNPEGEEIYFEGPPPQFKEAITKFYKQMSDVVEKTLTLSDRILEVLGSDEGLKKVKCELENSNVEAVFVIDKDAKIVGTSAAHADNAAKLVNKLMLEEKVQVDGKSKYLLKSAEWRRLCDEINTETSVRIHRNNWNDTYVAGFRNDVMDVMKKLNSFLESNCIRDERFVCSSQIVRRYLAELRQEDLRSIENRLKCFELKINKGKGNDDFDISGNKEGLIRARKKLDALIKDTASGIFHVKQPGLRKFFDCGTADCLVKSVEKDHSCAIQVQKNFGQKRDDLRSQAAAYTDPESCKSCSFSKYSHAGNFPSNFSAQMMQEVLQEQKDEEESDSSSDEIDADQPRMRVRSPLQQASVDCSVLICVIGKKKAVVEKAVESLKKGFSEACTTEKVESEVVSQLSHKQIVSLRRKAEDRDIKLVVEADVDRIVVRGQTTEVSRMVGEIWKEIGERTKKIQEEERAQLVSRNIEWSYKIHGSKLVFGRKANAKIEMASSKDEPRVLVPLRGERFVVDLKAKTGRGQRTGEQITLKREVKGAEEG